MYQFFAPLTEPVGAIWSFMVLGVLWLFYRRQWRSAIWLGCPTVLLFVAGGTPLAEVLVTNEERQWAGSSELGNSKFKIQNAEIENENRSSEATNSMLHGPRKSEGTNVSQVSAFSLQPFPTMPLSPSAEGSGFHNMIFWGLPKRMAGAVCSPRLSWCVWAEPTHWCWAAVGRCRAGRLCPR